MCVVCVCFLNMIFNKKRFNVNPLAPPKISMEYQRSSLRNCDSSIYGILQNAGENYRYRNIAIRKLTQAKVLQCWTIKYKATVEMTAEIN